MKQEKEPMKGYSEDLQRKMRLMNQKLLEEARERKYLRKLEAELQKTLGQLERDKRVWAERHRTRQVKTERVLGELQKLGRINGSGRNRI